MIGLYEVTVRGQAGQILISQRVLMTAEEASYVNVMAMPIIGLPTEHDIEDDKDS